MHYDEIEAIFERTYEMQYFVGSALMCSPLNASSPLLSVFHLCLFFQTSLPFLQHILRARESTSTTPTVSGMPSDVVTEGQTGEKRRDLSVLGHGIPYEVDLHAMYGDRAYHELPIVHVTTTRNNTKVALTDCNGRSLCSTSCGCEGFRNARKQTTVAAQTVGISIGLKAQKLGIKDVRVKMRGIGSNRVSTLSGMTLSGLKIVSLTDDTPIHYGMGRRPKKVPRK